MGIRLEIFFLELLSFMCQPSTLSAIFEKMKRMVTYNPLQDMKYRNPFLRMALRYLQPFSFKGYKNLNSRIQCLSHFFSHLCSIPSQKESYLSAE